MSNLMKIAIPLLNENLTYKDISEDAGFIDSYFEDINKPYLDNHIFMMYDANFNGKDSVNRFYKFKDLDNRYSTRVAYINSKPYTVYSFTIDNTIRNLRSGNIMLSPAQKARVLKFWDGKDAWIMNNVLLGAIYEHPIASILPEEDFSPDLGDIKKGVYS